LPCFWALARQYGTQFQSTRHSSASPSVDFNFLQEITDVKPK
jgi:hypothetical protein